MNITLDAATLRCPDLVSEKIKKFAMNEDNGEPASS